jgi:acyl carrier protein
MDPIHQTIQDIARRVFESPDLALADETTAGDVDKWDSLTHITFIVEVEKRFGLKFKNAEIARLQCIGDLKRLVEKHRSKPDRASA